MHSILSIGQAAIIFDIVPMQSEYEVLNDRVKVRKRENGVITNEIMFSTLDYSKLVDLHNFIRRSCEGAMAEIWEEEKRRRDIQEMNGYIKDKINEIVFKNMAKTVHS